MTDASLTKSKLPCTCLERMPFISSVYRTTEERLDAPEISVTWDCQRGERQNQGP